jgi:hypothetical protein
VARLAIQFAAKSSVIHNEVTMQRILVTGILGSALLLGGCVFAPGDARDWDHDHDRSAPTIGQQLIDLDRARDNGSMTSAEYEQTKAKILDSVR